MHYPAQDQETAFDHLLTARITDAVEVHRYVSHRIGKAGRRTPDFLQGHITRMAKMQALRRCQLAAYQAKAALVQRRKGHNTLAGIPAELCPVLP